MGVLSDLGEHLLVWDKGRVIPGWDATVWRWDRYGSVMRFADYGDRDSEFGWEKGHILADALGGPATLSNYEPLNWRNNARDGGLLGNFLEALNAR